MFDYVLHSPPLSILCVFQLRGTLAATVSPHGLIPRRISPRHFPKEPLCNFFHSA